MEEKSYFVNTATHAREVGTYLHTYERKWANVEAPFLKNNKFYRLIIYVWLNWAFDRVNFSKKTRYFTDIKRQKPAYLEWLTYIQNRSKENKTNKILGFGGDGQWRPTTMCISQGPGFDSHRGPNLRLLIYNYNACAVHMKLKQDRFQRKLFFVFKTH
jgi:hypothetical protein